MVPWDNFIQKVNEAKQLSKDQFTIEQVLQHTKCIYHQTMRKFGDSKSQHYVSIRLVQLSIESSSGSSTPSAETT